MKSNTIVHAKYLLLLCLAFTYLVSFGHGGEDHKKKKQDSTSVETTGHSHEEHMDEPTDAQHSHAQQSKSIKADLADFPTLHPLVVHFPIVLLLLAAMSQVAGLFFFKNELSWVTLFLITGGFIGAYVAGNYVHPHTTDLSEFAEKVLGAHEKFASYTTWFGGIALVLKLASHFILKRKWWAEVVVAIALVAAAYSVSIAGHYGAQLIHIEGIGAKGRNLELHGDSHTH